MPGCETGLAEQRGLLIAGDAADRDAGGNAARSARDVRSGRSTARTSGSARDRHAEQRAQLVATRPARRCRRASCDWRSTGRSRAPRPPVRFHSSQSRRCRTPGRVVGRPRRPRAAATRSWCRRSTDRARDRCAARTRGRWPASRSSSQRAAVRRSCHTMARWSGRPVRPVPRDDGLALVGDADRGDGLRRPRARRRSSASVARTASQISSASCSTQPGWGSAA